MFQVTERGNNAEAAYDNGVFLYLGEIFISSLAAMSNFLKSRQNKF